MNGHEGTEIQRLRAELMCRRQEIKALLEPVREFVDGHVLTPEEREYYACLVESLTVDEGAA